MPYIGPMYFGALPGYEVGFKVDSHYELKNAKIHEGNKPWRMCKQGVPSLLLRSIDVDQGDQAIIKYEQKLIRNREHENRFVVSIRQNLLKNLPIRVVRPSSMGGQYAPMSGYRYDGLYKVTEINSSPDFEKRVIKHLIYIRLLPDQPIFWQREPPTRLPSNWYIQST